MFFDEEYRHCGFGKKFFSEIEKIVKQEGFSKMEWSCLDWNAPAISFYNKIGAVQEQGRNYYSYVCK